MRRKSKILLAVLVLLAGFTVFNQKGFSQEPIFQLPWFTFDGGGGRSSGGNLELAGTAGQPDAGVLTGGSFSLSGGFWVRPAAVEAAPDLMITQSVSPAVAEPGQVVTYTLAYRNDGAATATGVAINLHLPTAVLNTTFEAIGPAVSVAQGAEAILSVADLAPGAGGTIIVTGVVDPALTADVSVVSTAVISADLDSFTGNNQADATLLVQIPQFEIYLPVVIK